MISSFVSRATGAAALALAILGITAGSASAVPAFAVQTGEPCQACHVGGFGPQLTPFGREFKLQGYTLRMKDWNVPLSAMLVASFVNTAKPQDPPPADGFADNNNFALDQISLFFAGGFGSHIGAFIQGTYDGVAKAWTWDNLDLRAVDSFKIKNTDVTVGASFNNNPTVQDAWNTLPAWGYPYTSSALAPGGPGSPLLANLAQTTLGLTGYAWINSEVYLEGGAYWSPGANVLTSLGADPTAPGSIQGAAPYARVAFQHDLGPGTAQAGAFFMSSRIFPGLDQSEGTDRYTDYGVDGSYQVTLKDTDVITFNARYLHEDQSLDATCALIGGSPDCAANTLTDARVDASYYWRDKVGLTVAYFSDTGNENADLWADNRINKPDTSGVTVQVDGTPFGDGKGPLAPRFNTRVGVQYTAFTQFDGAATNYDNAGHNASDNNTLRVFVWVAY